MAWLSDLFSTGASKVVKSLGNAIDSLVTSDEERLQLKLKVEQEMNAFKTEQLKAQASYDQEITKRWQSDNEHNVTRLVRPVAYGFVLVLFAGLVLFDGNLGGFVINEAYIPVIEGLLYTMTIAYFGSRGIEKVTKSLKQK